jgi:hypothetical protein
MPYRVDLHPVQHGVVVVTYAGPVTIEERAAALHDVLQRLSETSSKRVLVDFQHGWPALTSFEANNRHAGDLARAYATLPGLKIAYVSTPDPNSAPIVEMLAAARGYFYERFKDKAAALRWLD